MHSVTEGQKDYTVFSGLLSHSWKNWGLKFCMAPRLIVGHDTTEKCFLPDDVSNPRDPAP